MGRTGAGNYTRCWNGSFPLKDTALMAGYVLCVSGRNVLEKLTVRQ
jgi:hypothetical protein